jgi:uncharacterized lipoprotein YddW (UPF0748 family)
MMIKGFFLLYMFIIPALITSCVSCHTTPGGQTEPEPQPDNAVCETRATWLFASSIDSADKRKDVLRKLADANLNTIFTALPPVGQNFGYGDPDDFLGFLKAAKDKGFSLHGWITNAWRRGRNTESDFRDAAEQDAQVQWVADIMNLYGEYLDGIHLDYIRHLNAEAVNLGGKMDGVTAAIGKIFNFLETYYPDRRLTTTTKRLDPRKEENYKNPPDWVEDVPQWFRDWYEANPGSIYHGPDDVLVPLHMKYQQNPIEWIRQGFAEIVIPMQYTIDDERWKREVTYFTSFNEFVGNDPKTIYMGISWQDTKGFDAAGVVRKIKYGRSRGMKGFVIFILCARGIDDTDLIAALSTDSAVNNFDAPFENPAPSCLTPRNKTTGNRSTE